MESRTRLTLGGMATVAASVAVVCAVAMSTSAALADAPGAPAGAAVLVPAPAEPVAASAEPARAAEPPAPPQPAQDEPETVPAPEPEDVAAPVQAADESVPTAPAVEQRLLAQAEESGSWADAYAWASAHGWPQGRTDAWIARLEADLARQHADDAESSRQLKSPDADSRIEPAPSGKASGRDRSGPPSGKKREQSQVPPG